MGTYAFWTMEKGDEVRWGAEMRRKASDEGAREEEEEEEEEDEHRRAPSSFSPSHCFRRKTHLSQNDEMTIIHGFC